MVDNLSPACRKLVDGIQDLLRYKEDAQLAEAILPELIKMLKCKFFKITLSLSDFLSTLEGHRLEPSILLGQNDISRYFWWRRE